MNKVTEDSRVAVLYSPGFGAGWYTWNYATPECLFDPDIVHMVREGAHPDEIEETALEKWSQDPDYFYPGGADCLTVMWLPEGTRFRITEYDGAEDLVTEHEEDWIIA